MNLHGFPGSIPARFGAPAFGMGGPLTPLVRALLVLNGAAYAFRLMFGLVSADSVLDNLFGLVPNLVAHGWVWQLGTYMFLHAGLWHLLLNLLALFMFGGSVEAELGTRRFAALYAVSGVGAGLCAVAVGWGGTVPVVGASGAIFGILIAYAMLFPYRPVTLLVFFVVPLTLQARWLVALFGGIEVFTLMQAGRGGLGQVAHLGGILFGYLFMKAPAWTAQANERARARRAEAERRSARRIADDRKRMHEEVDVLLDKISREGMASLSEDERRRLREASERMKQL
jgi:membrane associated rhomboid family serine protease